MASNPGSQAQGGPKKRTSFSAFPGTNASIFLEKAKAGIRGSTPDSDALASSDDEQDHYHRLHSINQSHGSRQPRRPSWLSEVQQAPNRKGSLSGSGSFSPANSNPATPAADTVNWNANIGPSQNTTIGRPPSSGVTFPWSNAIWTSDSQKGPPTRLTEVLPSPTSVVPPGSAGHGSEEPHRSPSLARELPLEATIPFAIPLQPTLKSYRSHSYSVGQNEPDSAHAPATGLGGFFHNGRSRSGVPYGGLQHRPSRPSMLGEHDPRLLEQLQEVEDDDESSNGSEAGVKLSTQARAIEQLAMENALLRQAAADQIENSRGRSRAVTTSSGPRNSVQSYHQRIEEPVPEETDSALYDLDDSETSQLYAYGNKNGRRASEYGAKGGTQYYASGAPENRTLESVKKGHWQSSLGFGGLGEPPQSRRHSFADVPTRQASLSSTTESQKSFATPSNGMRAGGTQGSPAAYGEGLIRPLQGDSGEYHQFRIRQRLQEQQLELEHLRDRQHAVTYFSRNDPGEGYPARLSPGAQNPAYPSHTQYGRSHQVGHSQPRVHQSLYIVTFKACRADVFYVQEGTGLQVKPGDLVIVEADRGTDLGTVAHGNIPWPKAKEMKEHYTEEHYRWLMVFSRHCQDGTPAGANPNGQANTQNNARNGTTSAMGGSIGGPEMPSSDLKPKMIKRLAQAHEIQTLRDKEGNEAKAKRVCQQKVVEHRLNMEILDAEFQMDWKKLTFYYFADSYINFNPLVTDLFKIYKTRIWMSAINPASFVTPVAGLQLPSGLGPGAFNPETESYSPRQPQKPGIGYPMVGTSSTSSALDRLWAPSPDVGANLLAYPHMYHQSFQPLELETHQAGQSAVDYRGAQHLLSLQARYAATPYQVANLPHPMYGLQPDSSSRGATKPHISSTDWNHGFQGLSLGS